jgi:NAD(P)H-flavin reductase
VNAPSLETPNPWLLAPYSVQERKAETADTATIVLAPPTGHPPLRFEPGQFNMLYLFGVGEIPVSICGDPTDPEHVVHTIRSAGRISAALGGVTTGATVGVRGPYGTGWPIEEATGKDVVIVAGGLGLPPLRPVLLEMLRRRDRYGRIEIIYGAKSPRDLVYYDQIQAWRARSDLRFQTTVDTAGPDWYGDVGVVTTRLPDSRFEPKNTIALICGPEIMMKLAAQALVQRGVDRNAIWVSLERNMKCAIGLCGHCQFGSDFVCRDGPVVRYGTVERAFAFREL